MKITEVAKIRSKNASPFLTTIDMFFEDRSSYELVKNSGVISKKTVAQLYNIPEEDVTNICYHPEARGIKITIIKQGGIASGDAEVTDGFGCQQYIPLLSLEIPN
jgi:hypothetical protein